MIVLFYIQAKSQFKRRSTANNVEIHIPVPPDADSPKFKVIFFIEHFLICLFSVQVFCHQSSGRHPSHLMSYPFSANSRSCKVHPRGQ